MEIKLISKIIDQRVKCFSVLAEVTIKDYLENINKDSKLQGQREVLKTSSAVSIRKRMIDDLCHGAVIPPIVLGLLIEDDIDNLSSDALIIGCISNNIDNLSIIDGMQRTESLIQANSKKDIGANTIRIEFWISNSVSSLIYRMLVLNTGQVPWNLRRQIEIIHKPLINEVKHKVLDITLNEIDDKTRRTQSGEYPASSIVELYMVFGSRKETVDTKEKLADDFNRLDIIKMAGDNKYSEHFYTSLNLLVKLDNAISKYLGNSDSDMKINKGMDLFTSVPARVGFIAAIAKEVMGRPGSVERSLEEQGSRMTTISEKLSNLTYQINALEGIDLEAFLSFDTLNEKLSTLPIKRIGDAERDFYSKAFTVVIESKISSLNEAWMAY